MKSINTLQIGDDWIGDRAGGLGRYFYELLRALPATDTGCTGLVAGSSSLSKSTGGEVIAFARPDDNIVRRLYGVRQTALREMRQGRVDLICSHFALYGFALADQFGSTPMVQHFHGPWAGESGVEGAASLNTRLKLNIEKAVYSRARRVIVLSKSFRYEVMQRYGVKEENIRVVPGGIDTERFNTFLTRNEARLRLGWSLERPIILAVRRLVRRMGLENLIQACKLISEHHPEVLLLIGGSGPIAESLKASIVELGLSNNVQMLGRVDDVDLPTAYRAADMTVVPSQALEGFGLITLESLASGTPVYVTPVGGLPEVVEGLAPECVFENTSVAEIARVLSESLSGQRPRPSDEACRHYAEGFAWTNIAKRVRAVYDEALV